MFMLLGGMFVLFSLALVMRTLTGRPQPQPRQRRPLLLMTPGRGGSSFVSSWLSQGVSGGNKTLYFLEPCSVTYHRKSTRMGTIGDHDITGLDCADLIQDLFMCNFDNVQLSDQTSTHDGFDLPWGNTSTVEGCATDDRLLFIKEIRLGGPVFQMLLAGRSPWSTASAPLLLTVDRDPRAILASRKIFWPGWSEVMGTSYDYLTSTLKVEEKSMNPEVLWTAWLDEAVQETTTPFNRNTQRGYSMTTSVRTVCVEMLAARRLAGASHASPLPFLLLDYERDVLQRPMETAKRVLHFARWDTEPRNIEDAMQFVESYTSGKCEGQAAHETTCRNHSSGNLADDKWTTGLEPWELFLIESHKPCRDLLLAQGRTPAFLAGAGSTEELLEEAQTRTTELRREESLTGTQMVATFDVIGRTKDSSLSVGLFWVDRFLGGPGKLGKIKARHLVYSFHSPETDSVRMNTLHGHEFRFAQLTDASDHGASTTLLRWVANATEGLEQRVALDLSQVSELLGRDRLDL